MDSARRLAIAQRVLDRSRADATEVLVASERDELTRFTQNSIHQNVARRDVTVHVRTIVGNRTGVAAVNRFDDEALQAAIDDAIAMAKLAPADPDLAPFPAGGPFTAPEGAYAGATAEATPALRAAICDDIFTVAERYGYWCAGYVTTSENGITIANSDGVRASFDGTDAAVNVKMNGADSTGYGERYDNDVRRIDGRAVAETAARKAKESAAPREVEPGPWTVILEPAAFGELLAYLADHFSAQSYDERSSFLSDGLDRPYVGSNVTIADDYAHPLAPGMPFDYEGQPRRRPTLIERGIGTGIVTDSTWAKRLNRENTGHALPAPNAYGPQPLNLCVAPGKQPLTELIAQTKRGLLVTRFWYIRTVDPKQAIVTGMTRDGTFLIEDGAIAGGVRNLRFNQSILEALRRCEFGNELHRTGGYSYSLVVPAAKIEGFSFSSGTAF